MTSDTDGILAEMARHAEEERNIRIEDIEKDDPDWKQRTGFNSTDAQNLLATLNILISIWNIHILDNPVVLGCRELYEIAECIYEDMIDFKVDQVKRRQSAN